LPHRAVNRGGASYALAFFATAASITIAAASTCIGPDKPPKHPTTYYTDYMVQYQKRTYTCWRTTTGRPPKRSIEAAAGDPDPIFSVEQPGKEFDFGFLGFT
jgi:hypothetical protein